MIMIMKLLGTIGNCLESFGIYQRIFHVMTCFILVGEIQSFGILRCYLTEKQDSLFSAKLFMIIVIHYKLKQVSLSGQELHLLFSYIPEV